MSLQSDNPFSVIPKKGLNVVHLNVCSLTSKLDELKNIILSNSNLIHFFGISESWLHGSINDSDIQIPGYDVFRNDRNHGNSSKLSGGGVAAFVKSDIGRRRHDLEIPSIEMLCVELYPDTSYSCIVMVLYRPPDDDRQIGVWSSELSVSIRKVQNERRKFIIIGDFNVDISKRNCQSVELREILELENDVYQLINAPTRVVGSSTSLLDHVYVSDPNNIIESGVIKSKLSDHFPVFASCRLNAPRMRNGGIICYRKMKHFNIKAFQDDLALQPWSIIEVFDDIDDNIGTWCDLFNSCVEKHAPLTKKRVKNLKLP